MQKIIIIGGGASGLTAAITAKNDNNEVIILEQNNSCGKKLAITGNGRCNYWNQDQDLSHYHSYNSEYLTEIINNDIKNSVLDFINNIGILPKIRDGYYYPSTNQAITVVSSLLIEAKLKGIIIKTNKYVEKVIKESQKFKIICEDETLTCDIVVAAMGSNASIAKPYNGYNILKELNHKILTPLPSLVGLQSNKNYFKLWTGIRTNATIYHLENNEIINKETGEIQLTDYGVSGICIFNLSEKISKGLHQNQKEEIIINFYPEITTPLKDWLDNRNDKLRNRNIIELLEGTLNYKLVKIILKITGIDETMSWQDLTEEEKKDLVSNLTNHKLQIISTNSSLKAQVMSGGISLTEINPKTMESLICSNLYIIGELLDVDGDCGGYNLGFAWMSGIKAGQSIKEKTND